MSKSNQGKGNPKSNCGKPNNYGSNSRKPQGRRPSNKQKPTEEYTDKKSGDINNPSYYYEDETVLGQVMNFSFNEFGGVPIDIHMTDGTVATFKNKMIASYWLNPSIPVDDPIMDPNGSSGTNTAALRNYLALSGSNSKSTIYAPQDVILLILAIAELIKVAIFTARIFGVAYLFNYRNRTFPEQLIAAQGIDPDDFNRNLASYRVRFNKLLTLAAKIPFPADIPLFKKAAELYANFYMDDPSSALAQIYMFCPYSVWTFNEEYNEQGAGLVTTKVLDPDTPITMGAWLDTFESMINALANSTSLNAIYSDVMRLVQNGKMTNLITFASIPEDFVVTPVYNEEIKIWIHNALFMNAPLSADKQKSYPGYAFTPDNDVSCDANTNRVHYHPQFKYFDNGGFEAFLDFDHDQVTIEDKVKATRLSQRIRSSHLVEDGIDVWYSTRIALNDEYLVKAAYYVGTPNHEADMIIDHSFAWPSTVDDAVFMADGLSKFDWAPLMYMRNATGDPDKWHILGDLDYYTLIDYNTIYKMYNYEIIHLLQIG